jgi:hypothetical protein
MTYGVPAESGIAKTPILQCPCTTSPFNKGEVTCWLESGPRLSPIHPSGETPSPPCRTELAYTSHLSSSLAYGKIDPSGHDCRDSTFIHHTLAWISKAVNRVCVLRIMLQPIGTARWLHSPSSPPSCMGGLVCSLDRHRKGGVLNLN